MKLRQAIPEKENKDPCVMHPKVAEIMLSFHNQEIRREIERQPVGEREREGGWGKKGKP